LNLPSLRPLTAKSNAGIADNYARVKPRVLILPGLLLLAVVLFLYVQDALNTAGYLAVQKDLFLSLNRYLGQFPGLMGNLTQFGDALVFLAFGSIFFVYAPRVWEALLPGLLITLTSSALLKKIFSMPRPARVLDEDSFVIIGRKLAGMNSTPSGHSITVFVILTVVLFAFMPKSLKYRIVWSFAVIALGLLLSATRVGVGAHWPLDVLTGGAIGYVSGILGIFALRKWRWKVWTWVGDEKCRPLLIAVLLAGGGMLAHRMSVQNLPIYYLAFAALGFSLYKTISLYVQSLKNKHVQSLKTKISEK